MHINDRLEERYGIPYTKKLQAYIIYQIKTGKAEKHTKSTDKRGVYRVLLKDGQKVMVVYDEYAEVLVTALPARAYIKKYRFCKKADSKQYTSKNQRRKKNQILHDKKRKEYRGAYKKDCRDILSI